MGYPDTGKARGAVAHLAIFRAFVDLLARDENDNLESTPVLGIEEPRSSLAPSRYSSPRHYANDPPRQMFLTTHSPELAQSVRPHVDSDSEKERHRNGTKSGTWVCSRQPLLDDRDQLKLEIALRSGATEILFSRATVLCEGPSEVQAYPFFASALDIDMDKLSLSLVSVDWCISSTSLGLWLTMHFAYLGSYRRMETR